MLPTLHTALRLQKRWLLPGTLCTALGATNALRRTLVQALALLTVEHGQLVVMLQLDAALAEHPQLNHPLVIHHTFALTDIADACDRVVTNTIARIGATTTPQAVGLIVVDDAGPLQAAHWVRASSGAEHWTLSVDLAAAAQGAQLPLCVGATAAPSLRADRDGPLLTRLPVALTLADAAHTVLLLEQCVETGYGTLTVAQPRTGHTHVLGVQLNDTPCVSAVHATRGYDAQA